MDETATASEGPEGFRQIRYSAPPGATTVLLVRHGESQASRPEEPFPTVDGHGDPPLHLEGEAQAARVGRRLANEHAAGDEIAAIYVTTLQRTHQTAAPLAGLLDMTPAVEADLREVHLGEWEGGLLRQKVAEGDPLVTEMMQAGRWDVIPGAESPDQLTDRLSAGLQRIVAAHSDERVVVVVHGGVIGHLLHLATGAAPFTFNGAGNASISELVVLGDRWSIRRFNDTAHL
jgi:probable phosphoglycerate mutase